MKSGLAAVAMFLLLRQTPEQIPQLLPESQDIAGREIRSARAAIWDVELRNRSDALDAPPERLPAGTPPPPPPAGVIVDLKHDLPELPLEFSDVVMVGEVVKLQPFLTKSHTSLYTEFTVRVLERVKSNAAVPDSVLILQTGGKARLDDGRVIEWPVSGLGDPLQAGRQYLFFLTHLPSLDAYGIQSVWHVENGVIKAVFPPHKANAGRFQSSDGKSLPAVLSFLRSKL
jgi:hypothetical protein